MNISLISRNRKYLGIALLFIVLLFPYPVWGILSNTIYAAAIGLLLALLVLSCKKNTTKDESNLLVFYEIVCLVYLFLNLTIHGFSIGGILIRLPYLLFFGVLFMDAGKMKIVMEFIVTIVSVISIIGLFFYLLFLFGIPLPSYGDIQHYIITDSRTYSVYPFFLLPHTADLTDIVRFCGVYDEPGVFGTFSVFFLYFLKYNFKDWRTWVIAIVGIFSFSLFFFGMLFINLIFRSLKASRGLVLSIFVVALIGISYYYTKDDPALNALIWERFELSNDSDGKGINRMTEEGELAYEKIKGTSSFWFGLSPDQRERFWDDARGGSSYKNVVANNGMIFFALYMIFLLVYGRHYLKNRYDFLLYAILVVMCLYQRSNIFVLPYLFFYACAARANEMDVIPLSKERRFSLKAL